MSKTAMQGGYVLYILLLLAAMLLALGLRNPNKNSILGLYFMGALIGKLSHPEFLLHS